MSRTFQITLIRGNCLPNIKSGCERRLSKYDLERQRERTQALSSPSSPGKAGVFFVADWIAGIAGLLEI
jgi:hypothetical protein